MNTFTGTTHTPKKQQILVSGQRNSLKLTIAALLTSSWSSLFCHWCCSVLFSNTGCKHTVSSHF